MGEVVEQLVECGHKYYDIINTYTIEQLWLFYEKSIVLDRKRQHDQAFMFAQCMSLPLGGQEAGKNFKKYLNSLLPKDFKKAMQEERKREVIKSAQPLQAIGALGQFGMHIPMQRPTKKKPPEKPRKEPDQDPPS